MTTSSVPRYDSVCCGAVGTSPGHRSGCRFEIAGELARSATVARARKSAEVAEAAWLYYDRCAISENSEARENWLAAAAEASEELAELLKLVDNYAIGIAS
jgi:hypothetical protein